MPGPLAPDGRWRLSTRIGAALSTIFLVVMAVVAAGMFLGRETLPSPAAIIGQPVRAATPAGDRVFIVTRQWKVYSGGWGRGPERPTFAGPVTDVWAFDAVSATPVWRRRIALERAGVHDGRSVLGVDGNLLWMLHPGGVQGRAVGDGEVLADRKRIEAANPELRGLLPADPAAYRFDAGGLAFIATDGRKLRLGRDLVARPEAPAPARPPPGIVEAARIAGGSGTSAFEKPGFHPDPTRWIGLLSLQALPGFRAGQRGLAWDASPRMRLWSGRPARPPDGVFRTEYAGLAPLPQSPQFLQPALLGDGDHQPAAPPIRLSDPDSILVLHRDRLGAGAHLRLSRADIRSGRALWTADLPIQRLEAVMPGRDVLALYGHRGEAGPRRAPNHISQVQVDHIVAVDLSTGEVADYGLKLRATPAGKMPPSTTVTGPAQAPPAP